MTRECIKMTSSRPVFNQIWPRDNLLTLPYQRVISRQLNNPSMRWSQQQLATASSIVIQAQK